MSRVEEVIRAARAAGRPALAAFVTAGFPDREGFPALAERLAGTADLLEIGVPFSDPMADGVTIQRSSQAALRAGVTLDWIIEVAGGIRGRAPLLLMSYLNPLLAIGPARLARRAADAGIAGLVVPDLPFEECEPLRAPCDEAGIALVQLVAPATPQGRRSRLCAGSRGFVYAVTRNGTTGGAEGLGEGVGAFLDDIRAASRLPVLAGFGVRDARSFRAVTAHADGAIVGSALIEAIERGEDPVALLGEIAASNEPLATEERR